MKKYKEFIKFLLLITLVVFLYGFASHRNSVKKNNELEVIFNNGKNLFISYEKVNKLLIQNLGGLENQSKENINLNNVEQFLENNQMIEDAEIFQTINGVLGAIITQRTPVLRIANGLESYYYDEDGKKMPLSANYSARVPLSTSKVEIDNCDDIICLANKIKNDDFLQKHIIGIKQIKEESTNQFELKMRSGSQIVIFGDLKRMDKKIQNLKAFYQKSSADGSLSTYKMINLKFNDQVVCTKY